MRVAATQPGGAGGQAAQRRRRRERYGKVYDARSYGVCGIYGPLCQPPAPGHSLYARVSLSSSACPISGQAQSGSLYRHEQPGGLTALVCFYASNAGGRLDHAISASSRLRTRAQRPCSICGKPFTHLMRLDCHSTTAMPLASHVAVQNAWAICKSFDERNAGTIGFVTRAGFSS